MKAQFVLESLSAAEKREEVMKILKENLEGKITESGCWHSVICVFRSMGWVGYNLTKYC